MAQFSETAHWRDSGRIPRFLIVDARAALPIFIFFMHISWWTFTLFAVSMIFFSVVEHFGFSIPVFLRWLRGLLAGPYKTSQPWWY